MCSFENEADIKALNSSEGVKLSRVTDFAALNAHSLHCIFPEKGGSLTIQQFSMPSWNKALGEENKLADALLLFVWASQPGTINIQVEDSSRNIAGDKFSLKAGANHLQLPFAKLEKINTEKIKSLTVSVTEKAMLYIDYIALDLYQNALKNNGRWDVEYSNEIKTAHFPWGKNLSMEK